jgi:hypothetical protein
MKNSDVFSLDFKSNLFTVMKKQFSIFILKLKSMSQKAIFITIGITVLAAGTVAYFLLRPKRTVIKDGTFKIIIKG